MRGGWQVGDATGACHRCGTAFLGGGRYYAALFFAPPTVERRDFCPACWESLGREEALAYWCFRAPWPPAPAADPGPLDWPRLLELLRRGRRPAGVPSGLAGLVVLMLARRRKVKLLGVDRRRLRFRFPGEEEVREVDAPPGSPAELRAAEEALWRLLGRHEDQVPKTSKDDAP